MFRWLQLVVWEVRGLLHPRLPDAGEVWCSWCVLVTRWVRLVIVEDGVGCVTIDSDVIGDGGCNGADKLAGDGRIDR